MHPYRRTISQVHSTWVYRSRDDTGQGSQEPVRTICYWVLEGMVPFKMGMSRRCSLWRLSNVEATNERAQEGRQWSDWGRGADSFIEYLRAGAIDFFIVIFSNKVATPLQSILYKCECRERLQEADALGKIISFKHWAKNTTNIIRKYILIYKERLRYYTYIMLC